MSNLNKQYDTFCKQILARPIFLAYILKRCIHEFSNVDVFIIASKCIHDISANQKEVHRLSPFITQFEDDTLEEGKAVFDIFFMAHLPESDQDIDFYINIEIQDDFYPGYPLSARGVYYGSRMLSMQYEDQIRGSRYENLKKVYSIWICLNPPKEERGSITEISLDKNLTGQKGRCWLQENQKRRLRQTVSDPALFKQGKRGRDPRIPADIAG